MLRRRNPCVYCVAKARKRLKNRQRDILRLLDTDGRRIHGLLYRLTLSVETAEELLQELVMRLMKSEGFAAARDSAAFAFRAAIHLAMDWRRRQKHRRIAGLNIDLAGNEE